MHVGQASIHPYQLSEGGQLQLNYEVGENKFTYNWTGSGTEVRYEGHPQQVLTNNNERREEVEGEGGQQQEGNSYTATERKRKEAS